MGPAAVSPVRTAVGADLPQVLRLWEALFDDDDGTAGGAWKDHAREWFAGAAADDGTARLPVVEVDGTVVATAVGTVEIGVPNPWCPTGRTVRLANVFTVPAHRGRGYGTAVVDDVVRWARSVAADRVDLSATPAGRRLYENAGFVLTSAPRMKLVL